MIRYHFTFKSTYRGRTDYEVYDRETRTDRRIYVDDETGVASFMLDPIPAEIVDALNVWRRAKYDADCAHILQRYGAESLRDVHAFRAFQRAEDGQ